MATSGGSSGGGTISEITSEDSSVTITDPEGPTTDLSVAGGGGGGSMLTIFLAAVSPNDPTSQQLSCQLTAPFDPASTTFGYQSANGSVPPTTYGAMSTVLTIYPGNAQLSAPSTVDDYDVQVSILVTDSIGANVLTLSAFDPISEGDVGPITIATTDFTPTAVAGTDLAYDAATGVVTTTAGGVYAIAMLVKGLWD